MESGKEAVSFQQALEKLAKYCSLQERCHKEIRDKLWKMPIDKAWIEPLISELISLNFINEERFAKAYARGKFRIKRWGRVRIKKELKQKQISAYCIAKGMEEIDDETYFETLQNLAITKWAKIKDSNSYIKKGKLTRYLQNKGYEIELILDYIMKNFKN